jgi:predicted Zn-dependent peptidase
MGVLLFNGIMAQTKIDRSKRPKAGPAPVISIADPSMYKLANGITVLVVENHKLPKVSATYSIDAGPVKEGNKTGVMNIMGAMLGEGTTTMTKAQFDEAVDQMGADVNLFSSGGSTSALTRYFDNAFGLMVQALRSPAFPQESFDKIKSQALTGLKAQEKSAKAISGNVVGALSYGLDHPDGEFQTETTINAITNDDVKKAYAQYITPSRGYLTFVGDIKPEQAKALAEKALGDWKGTALSLPQLKPVPNPLKTEVDLVDVPNAVQSEITVTNLVSLPMNSPDYFPVLLANQILGGGGEARLYMNLREKHGFTYGCYSSINAGRFQTSFSVQTSVRNEKTDSSVLEILKEINRIRTQKITAEELHNTKALYNGTFALRLEDPALTASFASNILINNLPKDFYRTYLQKINAVTIEDVQRVAQKYFNYSNARVVVVGKAETVKPGLGKLGYSVKSYDRYAKPVTAQTTAAVKVNAADIISKYITAIGGAAELKKISSVSMTGEMAMQGMKLNVTQKKMEPNMELMEMVMGGNPVVHVVFDGKAGYQSQMGQKKEMTAQDIAEKKDAKGIFPQLFYGDGSYKLEVAGTDKVAGKDAYKIKITGPSGKISTEYYDLATGYLVKEETTSKEGGQESTQSIEYSNFKKVGNVLFAFTNSFSIQTAGGGQDFVIEMKDIKTNEGVAAGDFK